MILSCARRAGRKLGRNAPAPLLADILYGSETPAVAEQGLKELTTYALMKRYSMARIMDCLEHLERSGYLRPDGDGGLALTDQASAVLFHGLRVRMPVEDTSAAGRTKTPAGELSGQDAALFTALKSVRSKLARREGVPAYVIFSNATLTDMARRRPRSRADFLDVSGVGERKAQRYAKAFLEAIEAFESEEFS